MVTVEELEEQDKEYKRRIEGLPEVSIFGIPVDGATPVHSRGDINWRLVVDLHGWREGSGPLRKDELRIELPVPEEDIQRYKDSIEAYSVIHFRGRIAEHPRKYLMVTASDIVQTSCQDEILQSYAKELQSPVIYEDPIFGAFTLDRRLGWFNGHVRFNGRRVEVALSADSDIKQAKLAAAKLRHLLDNERSWARRLKRCAVKHLLPLKNDAWLGDRGWKVPGWWFKYRMKADSATIWPDGRFEFWYDDGDLFFGHSITVSGSVVEGPMSADISG